MIKKIILQYILNKLRKIPVFRHGECQIIVKVNKTCPQKRTGLYFSCKLFS